jgi:hypothetical protein
LHFAFCILHFAFFLNYQIMNAIRDLGLSENTLVVFTSDNGPWLTQLQNGGSPGLFQNGKGTTWEGGIRMVCLKENAGKGGGHTKKKKEKKEKEKKKKARVGFKSDPRPVV